MSRIILTKKYERQRISRRDEWRDKDWMHHPIMKSYAISKIVKGKVPWCFGCKLPINPGQVYISILTSRDSGVWIHRNYYCWEKIS